VLKDSCTDSGKLLQAAGGAAYKKLRSPN